jgi:hypothetical protein
MILFLLLQAAEPLPDIELDLRARARSVEIERKGEARIELRGAEPGTRLDARVEPPAEGRTRLRNVTVRVHARASVGQGAKVEAEAETPAPK